MIVLKVKRHLANQLKKIPVIFCGGVGNVQHIKEAIKGVDAIAIASILHYEKITVNEIKNILKIKNHEFC